AVTHNRHVPFFAIAVGFWMPQHWESVAWRISGAAQQAVRSGNYVDWFPTISLGATSALLALALAQRVCELPVDTRTYPVDAVDFISKHKLHGRMIVTFNWAQYVLAAVGTPVESNHGISVQFDGRFRTCYPQEIIDEHFDFVLGTAPHVPRYRLAHSPTNDDARILRRGNPNLVLISRRQSHSTTIMQQQRDDWALLYEDSLCQLWGRRNIYDDQDGCDFLPHEQRLVTPNRQPSVDYIAWPAFPPTSEPHTRFANRQPGLATPYSEQPQL
ncbi:MAG: hypothetical protein KDA99_27020, partial [Planctomycetales bacterium]|nr:hypothetical protein [Planctomycetales bacterium]